jgi:riboflavin biosynthesis pyrimidine reductase
VHVVWYTAMSIDGRLADANDQLSFLDSVDAEAQEQAGFPAFIASVDAVLVGATTMRWLLRGGHGWPHDDLPTWLATHDARLADEIGKTRAPLRIVQGELAAAFAEMEAAGHRRVWLAGGGRIAAQALALDRVDEIIVTIAPAVLGAGPAIFEGAQARARPFRLAECRPLGKNAARLRWVRDSAPAAQ